jgi:superfamily II DNA or RNA helicase
MARVGVSTVVLVPTRVLLEQWSGILREHFDEPIGIVGDGQHRVARVTVMTFESAYRCLDRFGDAFGMMIVDEAHHFAGGARAEALEMCAAPIRLGLTATPPVSGTLGAALLRDRIGPVVFELQIADLVGRDLAPLEMVRIHVSLSSEERRRYDADLERFVACRGEVLRLNPDADWLTSVRAIARMPDGSAALAGMHQASRLAAFPAAKRRVVRELCARHAEDRTLIFTAVADDAYAIGEQELVPVITADVSRAERDAILASFRDRSVRAICSARVLNEGIDVPEANVAIIVAGALGAREHIQRIGRVLRPREGKRALAYELVTLDTLDEARTRARRRRLAAHASRARHVA